MVDLKIFDEDSGKTHVISLNGHGTFSDIINALLDKDINMADESILLTNGMTIDINKTYNFLNNQKFILRNRNNLEGFAFKFNDVTKQEIQKLKVRKISNGCGWRYVSPGINLYGICKNENCEAANKEVIQIINDNEYDLAKVRGMMQCPMCKKDCIANTVGFYKCYYNIYGIKYNEESDENEKFGKKIPNFNSININMDDTVFICGQKYQVNKTDGEKMFKFEETNGDAIFIKLIFQVQKF